MAAFDDEATLSAYVGDETAWGQFAEAHDPDERFKALSELATYGAFIRDDGTGRFVLRTYTGRELGVYGSLEEARTDLRPGGKWWPL
jgi:hypothetical protein